MEHEEDQEELLNRAHEKIELGSNLMSILDDYIEIPGVQKIQRKIGQEVKGLKKVINNNTLKLQHVQCSNLTHYEFLVKLLQNQRDVMHVDCGFSLQGRNNPLRVDIVCDNGLKWIKAVARNSKSLIEAANGNAGYGVKSILDQAEEYLEATEENLCMFTRPKVVYYFSQPIHDELVKALEAKGVECATFTEQADVGDDTDITNISTLNLDITTLLAYVSSICNGGANWTFQERILTEQAEKEKQTPLKPQLDKLFENKRLITCQTAYKSFQDIVQLLAGPKEHERANELLQRIEVLPDVVGIPPELTTVKLSGKINERSLRIFSFGLQMKALTVTSNKAFVRSAKMQGINVPAFIHQARALTECKEATATPLS